MMSLPSLCFVPASAPLPGLSLRSRSSTCAARRRYSVAMNGASPDDDTPTPPKPPSIETAPILEAPPTKPTPPKPPPAEMAPTLKAPPMKPNAPSPPSSPSPPVRSSAPTYKSKTSFDPSQFDEDDNPQYYFGETSLVEPIYLDEVPGKMKLSPEELAEQKRRLFKYAEALREDRLKTERENARLFGFVKYAETMNGRFAMFFFVTGLLTEYWTDYTIPEQVELLLRTLGVI